MRKPTKTFRFEQTYQTPSAWRFFILRHVFKLVKLENRLFRSKFTGGLSAFLETHHLFCLRLSCTSCTRVPRLKNYSSSMKKTTNIWRLHNSSAFFLLPQYWTSLRYIPAWPCVSEQPRLSKKPSGINCRSWSCHGSLPPAARDPCPAESPAHL